MALDLVTPNSQPPDSLRELAVKAGLCLDTACRLFVSLPRLTPRASTHVLESRHMGRQAVQPGRTSDQKQKKLKKPRQEVLFRENGAERGGTAISQDDKISALREERAKTMKKSSGFSRSKVIFEKTYWTDSLPEATAKIKANDTTSNNNYFTWST